MAVKLGNVIPGTLESNKKIAEHLLLISMGLNLDGQPWKVRAFEDAAEGVMLHTVDVRETAGIVGGIRAISGVGDSTAKVILEFIKTGTSERYKALAEKHPMEAFTMTVVDGIGPKTAIKLHEAGYKNFDQLVEAAKAGKLDKKMTDAVLFAVGKVRVPHAEAKALAEAVISQLKAKTAVHQFEVCGSVRRKAVDSKDVDIVGCVASATDRAAALAVFVKLGVMIKSGEDRAAIRFAHGGRVMQVDLWLVEPGSWGAALCYATGSKNHNIELRAMASKKGLLVNEFGIFEAETHKHLGGADEHDLYIILGIPYVEPHERG
jgi:DNA polymerase (family 10)